MYIYIYIYVTQPTVYENRLNWIADPAPPASRLFHEMTSPAPAPAVPTPPAEVNPRLPGRLRSRRRRRRKAAASANENSSRLASSTATRPRSTANRNSPIPGNHPGISQPMRSTPVEHSQSLTSSPLPQHPIPGANRNSDRPFCQDHSEIWEFYKPARIDPSQDLTATHLRDNISGFGLSSPALQQPPTKPFSGPPSRHQLTDPYREAREAGQQRPGFLYPLLPRAARPDTRLEVDAALPEASAVDRRSRPPTVLDIAEPSRTGEEPQPGPSQPRRPRSRPSRKRCWNRSTGV